MHYLTEVRSGGQDGADLAGVAAAKVCGIPTGGWCPKHWKTFSGPKPAYEKFFGMKEYTEVDGYPPRTRANVRDSDGTVRFAEDFLSPGELCTIKAVRELGKPCIDIAIDMPREQASAEIIQWMIRNDIHRLNVAGNTPKTAHGIERYVYHVMLAVFGSCVADYRLHGHCLDRFGRDAH
jgi:hypothetical protein